MTAINKFNKSLLYTIRSPHTDKYYIGSTTQILCKRFGDHKTHYKYYQMGKGHFLTSFKILELGDAYIELLEEINCENRNQLVKREGEIIREHKEHCVNKHIPCRTNKEWEQDNHVKRSVQKKEYRLINADKLKEYRKEWEQDNHERISVQRKEYSLINADKLKEYHKEYKLINKEKINEKARNKYKEDILINRDKINEKARLRYAEQKLLKDLATITI